MGPKTTEALEISIGLWLTDFRADLASVSVPTLVIHDRQDRELDFHHAEALAAAGPFVTLQETGGLGHRRILQAKPVVESVTRFVVG